MVSLGRDSAREVGREIVTFVPDLVVMLRRVLTDPRVSQSAKVEAAAALAYLVSPRNRLTNLIPVVGQLDDVAIVAFAFRRLQVGAGEAVLREHWRGSDRSFQIMLGTSSALATPRGMIRKVKLVKTLADSAVDRLGGYRHQPRGGDGSDRIVVIEGEVIDRTPEADRSRSRSPEGPLASRPR
ncbi:DUF1232 domain-containing protein [Frankia sp. Cppng1_Ct_nod]|uniref:YkvA family protein n=1 Tax=Frankia sp. Cppng1_Ct_nod TaxID=2897162 RepID=UPI001041817C|nr:DUF1232 domain-containing protein [Frankia sp. Cppng1_Ct_nod]